MENKTIIIIGAALMAVALFSAPVFVQSGIGQEAPVNTNVLIGFDSWQDDDDDTTDGKALMVIRVFSAPTYTYSGGIGDIYYVDKVSVDPLKINKIDERIVASVKLKEGNRGRNVTSITWNTQKQIYP